MEIWKRLAFIRWAWGGAGYRSGRPTTGSSRPNLLPEHFPASVWKCRLQVRPTELRVRSTDLLPRAFLFLWSGRPSSVAGRPTCCCFAYFAYIAWFSKFNRFVLFPYLLLSFVIDFDDLFSSGILGISISMDSVSISLDSIHVFKCEFLWIDCFYNHFYDLSLKNIKVFYTSSKYQNSFFKWFLHYFITKLVFLNRFPTY